MAPTSCSSRVASYSSWTLTHERWCDMPSLGMCVCGVESACEDGGQQTGTSSPTNMLEKGMTITKSSSDLGPVST